MSSLLVALLMTLGQVDLPMTTPVQFGNVNDIVTVNLVAHATTTQNVAAIDAILSWNPSQLQFIGAVAGSYPWFVAGFLPDPDGINADLLDGNAIFTALAPVATPLVLPPDIVVQTFQFKLLTGGEVSLLPTLGAFGKTRVVSTTPGVEITGTISGPACLGVLGTWTSLGFAMAGTNGLPVLSGSGPQACEALATFSLVNGLPNEPAYFLVGPSLLGLPFKGGVLVPNFLTLNLFFILVIQPDGTLVFSTPWPVGLPSGFPIWYQYWFRDTGGVQGWAASNAIKSVTG